MKRLLTTLLTSLALVASAAGAAASDAAPRIDIDVANAPARSFFTALADGTPTNLVVHPDVSGAVTLRLKQVTLEEALEAARSAYGYDFRRLGNGYMILPATIQTRLFHVNYLSLSRQGVSRTRVSSGQITEATSSSSQGSTTAATGSDSSGGDTAVSTQEVTGTAILTSSQTDFWKVMESSVRALIGSGPENRVVANPQAGLLAVRAKPDELREVAAYLEGVENTVTRQVLLEAKIIEVELNDAYQAGINWATVLRDGQNQYLIGQRSPDGGFDSDTLSSNRQDITIGPGNPVTELANRSLGGAFTLAVDLKDFNAFIDLLKVQGNTRVLSSPRVATLNNQKAVIKAGSDEFFVTDVSTSTIAGTTPTTSRDVELTPFFSGIALDVTPQISDDNEVILHVHPTVSEVTDQTKVLTVAGSSDTLPLAFSEIREADSVVRARSGQVIVIGGLMRNSRKDRDYRTPYLGAIPVIGNLFKSTRNVERKTELVILLRPIVVDSDSQWSQLVAEPIARARALDPSVPAP